MCSDGCVKFWSISSIYFCRFRVHLQDGNFYTEVEEQPAHWTHVVLNYLGSENGKGIRAYMDGAFGNGDSSKEEYTNSAGNGEIVVEKFRPEEERNYASVELDELLFINATLTQEDIETLMYGN